MQTILETLDQQGPLATTIALLLYGITWLYRYHRRVLFPSQDLPPERLKMLERDLDARKKKIAKEVYENRYHVLLAWLLHFVSHRLAHDQENLLRPDRR